jgi:small subunit ribosomal protein S15
MLEGERKNDIITKFRIKEGDTGSAEVQVALLTERIAMLTEHLKVHSHDYHSRRTLLNVISRRKRLLAYLNKVNPERSHSLTSRLGLRK